MAVYDAFLFFNEVDLLELRMNILNPVVDYFVVSECDSTFSGKAKPFNFELNYRRFAKFSRKLIYLKHYGSIDTSELCQGYENQARQRQYSQIRAHYKNTDYPWKSEPHWCRDFLHREFVALGLAECKDDDVVVFSDVDEIPNPQLIHTASDWCERGEVYCLKQKMYYYYFNLHYKDDWMGSRVFRRDCINNRTLNSLRSEPLGQTILENGGWHFSFMGGADKVVEKLRSYGHQEFNNEKIISSVESKLIRGRDIFDRGEKLTLVPIDDTFPRYLTENIHQYAQFIKPDRPRRLSEMIEDLGNDALLRLKTVVRNSPRLSAIKQRVRHFLS